MEAKKTENNAKEKPWFHLYFTDSENNSETLQSLLLKAKNQYQLLEKLPRDIKFYEAYNEYHRIANQINDIVEIEKAKKQTSEKEGLFDGFFGYVNFRVVFIISILDKDRSYFFKKLPENPDKWFIGLKYHFCKLAKMNGDIRFGYWFEKTETLLNDFLDQIETTELGNKFFMETNIMNVMHEILDLVKKEKILKELEMTSLEKIRECDVHGVVNAVKVLGNNSEYKKRFNLSLRDKGDLNIIDLYTDHKMTKESMMVPVHDFQTKLDILTVDNNEKFSKKFYIRKVGDDFFYKGDLRILSKNNNYYRVFCALYDLVPDGGEITYEKLGVQIKSKIKSTKNYNGKEMILFIQANLTDKTNGVLHYLDSPENEDNSRPLLSTVRGKGIFFNNKRAG